MLNCNDQLSLQTMRDCGISCEGLDCGYSNGWENVYLKYMIIISICSGHIVSGYRNLNRKQAEISHNIHIYVFHCKIVIDLSRVFARLWSSCSLIRLIVALYRDISVVVQIFDFKIAGSAHVVNASLKPEIKQHKHPKYSSDYHSNLHHHL